MSDKSVEEIKYFINQSSSFDDDKPVQLGDIRMATSSDNSFSMKVLVVDVPNESYVQVCGIHTYLEMQSDQDFLVTDSVNNIFSHILVQKDVQFFVWKHQLGVLIDSLNEDQILSARDKVGEKSDSTFDARFYFKQEQINIAFNITQSCSAHLLQLHYQTQSDNEED